MTKYFFYSTELNQNLGAWIEIEVYQLANLDAMTNLSKRGRLLFYKIYN